MNRYLCIAAFVAGLVLVVWIGAGYIGSSPLALAMTVLIGAVYVTGVCEMLRFQRETLQLSSALAAIPIPLSQLGDWLVQLPPSLRNSVRLRVEGERVGLPGPALTPYLVGLLVLLGMLGTFLGMTVTLGGAVSALESTTDLETIRAALAAPVKGLGVAFGTSIAGVGASAMLGLVSVLCRRERLQAAQLLESAAATTLRGFSLPHQQRETFRALELQTAGLPAVVESLQGLMAQMERQSREANERLVSEQERFYADAKGSYAELAATVGASVTALSGQLAAEQERFYRDAKGSYTALTDAVGASVEALKAQLVDEQGRFYSDAKGTYAELAATVGDSMKALSGQLVDEQARFYADAKGSHAELAAAIDTSVGQLKAQLTGGQERFYSTAGDHHAQLAAVVGESVKALQEQLTGEQTRFYSDARDRHTELATAVSHSAEALKLQLVGEQEHFYRDARASYTELAAAVGASMQASVAESARLAGASIQPVVDAAMSSVVRNSAALQEQVADTVGAQLEGIAARFDGSVTQVTETWTGALATHERVSAALTAQLQASLQAFADSFEQRALAFVAAMREQGSALQSELVATDQSRQMELAQTLEAMAASLQQEWQQVGAQTLAQQEQLCATLGATTRDIVGAAQAQASSTIAEVTRLMETTAEVPRTAAEVIGELRRELSASIARDNDVLIERTRIMEALTTLLAGLDQASSAQREAIDGLVTSSTAMLEGAAGRFAQEVDTESERLHEVAAQITGGAVEVASLGESFTLGVQLFADANDKLMTTLARIEGALDKSSARSDEQLAYYVAQAREIVDLTIMSQRQIIDELQQRTGDLALAGEA